MRHKRFDDALDAAESSPETPSVPQSRADHEFDVRLQRLLRWFHPPPPAPPWGQRHVSLQAANTEAAEFALAFFSVESRHPDRRRHSAALIWSV